jgi:hypothetical protein
MSTVTAGLNTPEGVLNVIASTRQGKAKAVAKTTPANAARKCTRMIPPCPNHQTRERISREAVKYTDGDGPFAECSGGPNAVLQREQFCTDSIRTCVQTRRKTRFDIAPKTIFGPNSAYWKGFVSY